MKKRLAVWGIVVAGLVGWSFSAQAATENMVMLDKTDTTDDWIINSELSATGYISVTDGPDRGTQAVTLRYDLSGGRWVNMGKEYRKNLEKAKALVFYLKGEGGQYTLEIKIADLSGTTYGIRIPGGVNIPQWRRIVLPIDKMEYMWGGTDKVLDLKNTRGIDFAISTEQPGVPGFVSISQLQYSTEPMTADLPEAKMQVKKEEPVAQEAPLAPEGQIDMGAIKDWRKFSDKGASIELDFVQGPQKAQRGIRASFTWGKREVPGVEEQTGNWVAFTRDINMDLSEVRDMTFVCRSTGSVANLEVKLIDQANTVYGRNFSGGSSFNSWTRMTIPRKDFNYMWGGDGTGKFDWNNVARIEFALTRTNDSRDTGTFMVADIRMESAAMDVKLQKPGKEPLEEREQYLTPGRMKVVLDDFSDLNPTNRYFINVGDDSTLSLSSSRITFEADYSLQLRYVLQSARATGSWVEAQRRFSPSLNWTGVEEIKVWVKGDASRNIFRITITDEEDTLWAAENRKVLVGNGWYLVSFAINDFVPFSELGQTQRSKKNLTKQLTGIKQMSLALVSQPEISSLEQGEIYIENLYLVGRGITKAKAVPMIPRLPEGLAFPLKNWNIGGMSATTLTMMPNNGTTLDQNLTLKLTGNFEKFSTFGEIRWQGNFGDEEDEVRSKSAELSGPSMGVTILDPMPGINDIVIGNLWFNVSPHIFANDNVFGGWGFKGMLVEGTAGKINHHTYFLKHAPDSYTVAGQYTTSLGPMNANLIGTYFNNQPFIHSASQREDDDKALFLEMTQRINWKNVLDVNLTAQTGYDWYQEYWDASTQSEVDNRLAGGFLQGEINFSELSNVFWPGLSLTGGYRYVEPDFKPTYRQNPSNWDKEYGDQKGYNLRIYQRVQNAFVSGEYAKLDRLSNYEQNRERSRVSVGYYDGSSLDVTLSQEYITETYNYLDERYLVNNLPALLVENNHKANTEFYVAYHLSGNFVISEKVQFQTISPLDDNPDYTEMFTLTKVSYYPVSNLIFSIESKFSRYGRDQDVPIVETIDPTTRYEYTWFKIEMTF